MVNQGSYCKVNAQPSLASPQPTKILLQSLSLMVVTGRIGIERNCHVESDKCNLVHLSPSPEGKYLTMSKGKENESSRQSKTR